MWVEVRAQSSKCGFAISYLYGHVFLSRNIIQSGFEGENVLYNYTTKS